MEQLEQALQEAVKQAEKTGLTGPEKKEWAKRWVKENVEAHDHLIAQWMDFAIVDWLQNWALDLAIEWAWGKLTSLGQLK
jgi:hypothetical protein